MAPLRASKIFFLVIEAKQVGLNITCVQLETPMIGFLATRPNYDNGIDRLFSNLRSRKNLQFSRILCFVNKISILQWKVQSPFPYTLEILMFFLFR